MPSLKAKFAPTGLLAPCSAIFGFAILTLALLATDAALAQTKPASPLRDVQQHIDKIASCLTGPIVEKDDPHACHSLKDRMAETHVPGVSVTVIHNGAIEWAQGFGVAQVGGQPVNTETLFQAGSISKPVAAMAALSLVQQGKLSLDATRR